MTTIYCVTFYKGFEITTLKNSHCAMIYNNDKLFKCIAGDIFADGSHNAVDKAILFIDSKK
jgi:formate dehydrogenase assembly factor FdhD